MTWQADNSRQLYCLFLSCGCGFWLALLYELFGWWRRRTRYRLLVAMWDALFVVTAAIAVFLFALPLTGGRWRWYILLGVGIGFVACRKTAVPLLRKIYRLLTAVLRALWRYVKRLLAPLGQLVARPAKLFAVKGKNFFKKRKEKYKNLLQQRHKVVYNQNNNN